MLLCFRHAMTARRAGWAISERPGVPSDHCGHEGCRGLAFYAGEAPAPTGDTLTTDPASRRGKGRSETLPRRMPWRGITRGNILDHVLLPSGAPTEKDRP
jgi:hypothetical protein